MNRCRPLLLAAPLALIGAGAARSDSAVGYQLNQAHTGARAAERARTAGLELPATAMSFPSAPIVDNRVFLTASRYRGPISALAFDLRTGARLWRPKLVGPGSGGAYEVDDAGRLFSPSSAVASPVQAGTT